MGRRFWTREELQAKLAQNPLGCDVTYMEREHAGSPSNWITYMPMSTANSLRADDVIHINRLDVQVVHMHKLKLDSIAEFMAGEFNAEPSGYLDPKDTMTDYWHTYYRLPVMTGGVW
jgi:hypothetical protein